MNSYFSSTFTVEHFANFPTQNLTVQSKLSFIQCSNEEIENLLPPLKPHKSPGPDFIPARILKKCAPELAPSITELLYKSFSTCVLPFDWKLADIYPVYKTGPKQLRVKCP